MPHCAVRAWSGVLVAVWLALLLPGYALGFVSGSNATAGSSAILAEPNAPIPYSTESSGGASSPSEIELQDDEEADAPARTVRDITPTFGVGAYFAWYKLLLIAIVYLLWVFFADRMNRDLLRWGEELKMPVTVWNLINMGGFAVGLLAILAIPLFWVGWPLYLIATLAPFFAYSAVRRSTLKGNEQLAFEMNPQSVAIGQPLPQDQGAEIDFTPAGDDQDAQTRALISARRIPQFPLVKNIIGNMLAKRADLMLFDFTKQEVNGRMQVDGAWHPIPTLSREDGDQVLVSLKLLAGLNPQERRLRQVGDFRCKYHALDLKTGIELLTLGVPTGERAQIKILRATGKDMTLAELGMWPEASAALLNAMNSPGFSIISGPPRNGLTTTWRSALLAMDRYTRDCILVVDPTDTESTLENLVIHRFPEHGSPYDVIRPALLTEPEVIVIPNIVNAKTMDLLTEQIAENRRCVITRIQAVSAVEALLRIMALAKNRKAFVDALQVVSSQRLVRKLCDMCKVSVPVKPEWIQKVGGDPSKVQAVWMPFVPPPPGTLDEQGKPIEIPLCPQCQGFGYFGRTAIFETLVVTDGLRGVLMKTPTLEAVTAATKKLGHQDQYREAYRLVLAGVTSIDEIKRVFQAKS